MSKIVKLALLLGIAGVAGCTAKQEFLKEQNTAVIKFNEEQQARHEKRVAELADATTCASDECRIAVKGMAAVVAASTKPSFMPLPRWEPSFWEKAGLAFVDRVLPMAVQEYGQGYGVKKQTEVQIAQWNAFGTALNRAMDVAEAGVEAGPDINNSFNTETNTDNSDNSTSGDTNNDSFNSDDDTSQEGDGSAFGNDNDLNNGDNNDNSGEIRDEGSDGPISDDGDDGNDNSTNTPGG